MKTLQRLCTRLVLVSMVVALVAGCGDDQVAQGANDGANDQNQNNQSDPQGEDDCEDDEYWHPIEEECRDDEEAGGTTDCDPGEEYDADQEECVSKCPVNEIWDEDEQECINASQNCGEFEEWDEQEGACVASGECGLGSIVGQSCRPDGGVLPGAEVTVEGVDCDGMEFSESTTADNEGNYDLDDIPSGTHEMIVSSGSWQHTDEVTVLKGEETDLTSEAAKICVESTDMDIAVFDGSWDAIDEILDGMDIDYDHFTSNSEIDSLVGDIDEILEYDIIFAECSTSLGGYGFDTDDDILLNNIRRFVNEGNSLYASDLSDEWIERTFPDAVDFSSTSGSGNQTVTADVLSTEMQNLLGSTTTEIYFNMGGWTIAEDGGPATTIHFEADVQSLDEAALMLQYNDPIGDGRAIYTSFHNDAQATDDMEEILEYMIFQL